MTMDPIYIVAILLQAGILVYFVRRALKARAKKEVPGPTMSEYERTRLTALSVTPQQLGLDIPPYHTRVYGVVMDWDMNGTILTLTAYITGAANALLSTGATALGTGSDPAVAEQASEFVQVAQEFLPRTVQVSNTAFPPLGTVKFSLLTNHGIYAGQELLSLINDNTSPWMGLFFRGNMVLDEIKSVHKTTG